MTKACPGEYRHRFTVQTVAEVSNGKGGTVESVAQSLTVRGKVVPGQGGEGRAATTMEASRKATLETHYRDGFTSANRVVFGTRVFRILAVRVPDENPLHGVVWFDCEEVAPTP